MKQVLTQSDVAKAISDLVAQGKKPTMAAIHAAVGGKGSMSTLHRIKADIDAMAQTQPATDSPEAQQAFRTVWNLAVDQGRKQNEAIIAELRDNIRALAVENERQEGDATLWQNRAVELEKSQARAEADRQAAQSALCEASAQSARALQQLADAQADHASQTSKLQANLDEALRKAHGLELELVRSQARLGSKGQGTPKL
jgi:hypothetical protein